MQWTCEWFGDVGEFLENLARMVDKFQNIFYNKKKVKAFELELSNKIVFQESLRLVRAGKTFYEIYSSEAFWQTRPSHCRLSQWKVIN